MEFNYVPQLPPIPTGGGRAVFEWHAKAKGPLWAYTEADDWTFAVYLGWKNDEVVAGELRVFPTPGIAWDNPTWSYDDTVIPGRGLSATPLKNFRYGELIAGAIRGITSPGSLEEYDFWEDLLRSGGFDPETVLAAPPKARRGRPQLHEKELLRVAYYYDQALTKGEKAPNTYVSKKLYETDEFADLIRQRVAKCRQRGFLSKAPAGGRAGGHLTPKAKEALARIRLEIAHEKEVRE